MKFPYGTYIELGLMPVDGEFRVRRQSVSETDRHNAAARWDDRVRREQVTMRRRVAQAFGHRASDGHDARCNNP